MKFTISFSAIHAYLCADGYVIKNPPTQKQKYYYIGFRNYNETLLDDFEKQFFRCFGIKPRRCKDGRSVIQNKSLYLELTKNYSYYSKDWTIPKLNKKQSRIWLRAYFDCEGWVISRKAKDRHIGLDSINEKGIQFIQESLLQFKIKSKLKKVKNRNLFRLLIFGKDNIKKFQKEINFLHPKKKNKIQEAIDSYIDYNWDFSDEQKLLRKLLLNKKSKRVRINSILKKNIIKLSHILGKNNIHHTTHPHKNKCSNYFVLNINMRESIEKLQKFIKN
ncbi:MAG: LAGLIDADG family homing endonuclease [Candidatus Woesearchaeota archaeon]